ncbi:MAG: polyketide cyclase / dehydrase and lipid transport [Candidatus Nanopelagicales bacterium]|nr:polyketide cyclase / dehydrase and lipid transport [Candidatus Nanopelagicales bacterium]MDZ4249775.1 polyketide cyclase / dehydrase and lipid transport [Candidatus Nanopelagicales bacterium]
MPVVDLVDETFLVVSPARLAAVVQERRRWAQWWPELSLSVFMDRGVKGIRWSVTGAMVGSAELWLEEFGDGVILHYYLRADPVSPGSATQPRVLTDSPRGRRAADRLRRREALRWKRTVWALKAEMEGERQPGDGGWR